MKQQPCKSILRENEGVCVKLVDSYNRIQCYECLLIDKSGGNRASPSSSSIWDHVKQAGHVGTLEDFSIIIKTGNSFHILIHENLFIQSDIPYLDSQQPSISTGFVKIFIFFIPFSLLYGALFSLEIFMRLSIVL